ncbi:hypothetical protein DL96DRAFT_940184 [Flagelloscypha sp. PMI_526]|nr:hypothetical protein DL96DRAFT_940184 [Flagelloscypha sp. PMI_526]
MFKRNCIKVLSLLDIGILSFYLNPCFAIFTLLLNGSILLVARRSRKLDSPSFFWTAVICQDLLAVLWLAAHIVTVAVIALPSLRTLYNPALVRHHGLPAYFPVQVCQAVVTALETMVVVAWSIKGHLLMGKEKETGEDVRWRKIEQLTKPTPFTPGPPTFSESATHRSSNSWDSQRPLQPPNRVLLVPVRRI